MNLVEGNVYVDGSMAYAAQQVKIILPCAKLFFVNSWNIFYFSKMQNIFFVKAWLMNATVQENILFGQAMKPARLAH